MRWLSEGAEVLAEELKRGNPQDPRTDDPRNPLFEAIVIGSGYGGAVAALRLAQAGYRVAVLERGEEMLPGEFPNDMSHLPGHVRVERADRPGVIGRRSGLFDVRLHGRVTTLVGNALGGGSQINANVALRADRDVLSEKRWPAELRDSHDPLDRYYSTVEQMLGVAPYPGPCTKADELRRLEAPLNQLLQQRGTNGAIPRASFARPPLAVSYATGDNIHGVAQSRCSGCGDCVTGCNVGAKNTLTMNYLPQAWHYGARFFTGATVVAVDPTRSPERCDVQFVYGDHDWSHVLRDSEESMEWLDQPGHAKELFTLSARIVVLAAGSLGSTEILLRSRYLNRVPLSPRLGKGFSGNGDALHFGFDQDRRVNAIGWGCDFQSHANDAPAERPGPTIVSMLDVRAGAPAGQGVVIEDGIMPGALAQATGELITTVALLGQLDSWGLKRDGGDDDPLAVNPDALACTQVYLGMGHDAAKSMGPDARESTMHIRDGRVVVEWNEPAVPPAVALQKDYLKVAQDMAKAVLLANPATEPIPAALQSALSGPPPSGGALVVHPLGGCAMADHFEAGVVNHLGAVFSGALPRSVYGSLYVWDGSIVPGSLGVNPFLTIAALAERAAELVAPDLPPPQAQPRLRTLRARPAGTTHAAAPQPTHVRLQETMEEITEGDPDGVPRMVLRLRMDVPDLGALLRDRRHQVRELRGVLHVPGLTPRARLRIDRHAPSLVELLVTEPGSRLPRLLRGLWAWWRKRGCAEVLRGLIDFLRGKRSQRSDKSSQRPSKKFTDLVLAILHLAHHAGERRLMNYRLQLRDSAGTRYELTGVKTIDFAQPANRLLHALIDLDAKLVRKADGELLRRGILRLNLVALAEEDVPQVRAASDLPNALIALAGLPLFFARVLLKIRFWDFQAPDYAPRAERQRPEEQPHFVDKVTLKEGPVHGQRAWIDVPRGGLSNDKQTIRLALTRFEPPQTGAHRTPLLMLPGFAQSTRALTCEALEEDLVRHMLRQGFDVWLFDYRTSTALPTAREQSSLDDIARHDIPGAVRHILARVTAEGWRPSWNPAAKPQIAAFGHCMGSATLAMSLLSGALNQGGAPSLRALILSQVPLVTIPSDYSRYRRQLAAFLRDAAGFDHVNFGADDSANASERLIDRLLATQPAVLGDCYQCEGGNGLLEPRTDIATCRRVSGIIGPLYNHANVNKSHRFMHHYFGWGSMSVFMQITKFFEYHRLVSADGTNHYVTDDNIAAYMKDLPVALLHGSHNQVFKFESAQKTREMLDRVNGRGACELIKAQDYAHFDCLVGDRAHVDIYPRLSSFLRDRVLRGRP